MHPQEDEELEQGFGQPGGGYALYSLVITIWGRAMRLPIRGWSGAALAPLLLHGDTPLLPAGEGPCDELRDGGPPIDAAPL